jgi:hypothetical protein
MHTVHDAPHMARPEPQVTMTISEATILHITGMLHPHCKPVYSCISCLTHTSHGYRYFALLLLLPMLVLLLAVRWDYTQYSTVLSMSGSHCATLLTEHNH